MNKKLLLSLQKRNNARLTELRGQLEKNEVRAEDLEAIQAEVQELADQAQEIADALANLEGGDGEGAGSGEGTGDDEGDGEGSDDDQEDGEGDGEGRSAINSEQRSAIMKQIGKGLSTRGAKSTKNKEKEIRSAFANFVVGNISEAEARSLGVEVGNGSVTIPEVISSEIITYAQEENLLRKYGTRHRTNGNVKYPVLVQKANANVSKNERTTDIPETEIEFDEILLDPAEFDALATVTKKLIKMSGVNVEEIVIEELKKAYVRKETNYMFNGNDVGNENPGALAKKAVQFYQASGFVIEELYDTLVKLKNTPTTEVVKKSRWIINRAALTLIETMKSADGFPLLRPLTQAEGGIGVSLLGYPLDFTDNANGADPTKPIFYFGDFSKFHIQDVIGAMELQKLVEKYSGTNKVGFQIYNLLDGQLVYSPFEPAVYRYEVGATAPVGG
ncbi:phage major capsid protein [Neobacillus sp. FSL H8-0543]|uniref:phage major capsid protein n=1 Tax=Neobacillus sp. FSL H8-0543 TaxID=2954672 RepID=UPI00315823CD